VPVNARDIASGTLSGSAQVQADPGPSVFDVNLGKHAIEELRVAVDALTAAYLFLVPGSNDAEAVRKTALATRDLIERTKAWVKP